MGVSDFWPDSISGHLLTDAVTGALSRAAFELRLGEELQRSAGSGKPCSLCLFDIDHFKSVNDAFGHLRGDEVLRQVVDHVTSLLRGSDAVFRYGGDEFVLLLPEADKSRAAEVAQRVVEGVGRITLTGEPPLRVSISLGVASFPLDAAEPAALVAVADARAYLAKRRGRDCVVADDATGDAVSALPPLLERDTALSGVQEFLARLVTSGPGVMRVGGARGAGHSRFTDEIAKLAGLRGFAVLRPARQPRPETVRATPPGEPSSVDSPGVLVVADGESTWAEAAQVAEHQLAAGAPTVGLVLAGPGNAAVPVGSAFSVRDVVELTPWTPAAIRAWLRTRLRGEPSAELVEHLGSATGGLPARAERTLIRLVDAHGLHRTTGEWTLADPPTPVPAHRPLPALPTELVGRGVEIDQVIGLLETERLVTLTGPGGIGKTRLALAVAAAVQDRYDDGVVFVMLAEATDAGHVERAVAQALEMSEAVDQPLTATIAEHLADRHLLLVLDNFEQVHAAVGRVAAWLSATEHVTILVTSRERLRLSAERVYAVPGLTLPPRDAVSAGPEAVEPAIAQSSALALVAARAQQVAYDFTLTPANLPAVAEICHLLDGVPLALELAAAHFDAMTPEQLLGQLADRLDMLADGPHDMPTRHQTIRAAIGWSYDLLNPADRELFTALGVFPGGCDLAAIAAVCPTDKLTERMAGLVDKSLVIAETDPGGGPPFRTLRTIRAFANERLSDSDSAVITHQRHAAHYAALAERAAAGLVSPDQSTWMNLLSRELHNIRAALAWSLGEGDPQTAARIGAGIWLFWGARGMAGEGREWLGRVLEARAQLPPALLANVLYGAGAMARDQGDISEARLLIEESLECARSADQRGSMIRALRKLGQIRSVAGEFEMARALFNDSLALARGEEDRDGIAYALSELGDIAIRMGRLDEAKGLVSESLELIRAAGNTFALWVSLARLGEILMFQGDVAGSRPLFEESLMLGRDLGDGRAESWALHHLGKLAELDGDPRAATRLFAAGLALRHQLQERQTIADSLEALAGLAIKLAPAQAARLFGAAEELRHRHRLPRPPVWQQYWDTHMKLLDAALDDTSRHTAWTAGQTAPLEQIVNEALTLEPAFAARHARR